MFIVQATWDDAAKGCVVTNAQPSLLNVLYFFSKLPYSKPRMLCFLPSLSSDGIRLDNPGLHLRRVDHKTYCTYGSLETSFPRWARILLGDFQRKLYSSCESLPRSVGLQSVDLILPSILLNM